MIVEKNADLVFITETWVKNDDKVTISNLVPNGFDIVFINRKLRTGGGVAIIYRSTINIISIDFPTDFLTFEMCCLKIKTSTSKSCFHSCVYRPTKSKKNTS